MRFFVRHGPHVPLMGGEVDQRYTPLREISPHRCNDTGIGPPKLKFLLKFYQNSEYKRPIGVLFSRNLQSLYLVSGCVNYYNLDGFAQGVTELWQICVLTWGHNGAIWRIWFNLCILRSSQFQNPNGDSISSAAFAQLMAESPYTLKWALLSPKLPLPIGEFGPPSNTWFLGPIPAHNTNGILISSAVFYTDDRRVSLYFTMVRPFPPFKLSPSHGGSRFNTRFLGPTQILNANSIWIASALSQGSLVWQTDRPLYSLSNNRPHLCM